MGVFAAGMDRGFVCLDCWASSSGSAADTMSRIEIIPKELLFPGMLEDFLKWLLGLNVTWLTKKEILCDWCTYTCYPLTAELVARLGPEG